MLADRLPTSEPPAAWEVGSILSALNGILPDDLYIHSIEEVPESFHARFDARERAYRYYIALRQPAIGRQYTWFVRYDLDLALMNRIAARLVGDHDFESFCKFAADVEHYRCTVVTSRWIASAESLEYEIRANRFLRGMVRALVGTMVDIGRGYIPESSFEEIMTRRLHEELERLEDLHWLQSKVNC